MAEDYSTIRKTVNHRSRSSTNNKFNMKNPNKTHYNHIACCHKEH